jgi:ribosomal protein S18 acetylase RimI-like enzyme
MKITLGAFRIYPILPTQTELARILEVYRQCEDFLALGPVASASLSMVEADLEHSVAEHGTFCAIEECATGVMAGIFDYTSRGFEGDPTIAFLSLLMIAAPYRAHGLGEQVVRAFEAHLRQDPTIRTIRSGVQANNPGAIRFWQRMGFQIVSEAELLPDGTTCFQLLKVIC